MNKLLIIFGLLILLFVLLLSGCDSVTSTPITAITTTSTLTTLSVSPTTSPGIYAPTSAIAVTSTSTQATVTPSAVTSATTTSASPVTTTSLPAVPALYQPLYNQLQGYITNSIGQIAAQWDGSAYPVNYSAELVTADTNAGPGILQNSEQQIMIDELNGEAAVGVKAVTVEIGCPVFDPNFYIFSGQTAAQAQQTVQSWLDYYQSLAQAVHSRGLKMIVESNPLLTYYISSASSFNPGSYYKTLTFAAYEQLRSRHNIIIAQQIKPDYLILQTEPQTDAVNDFRPELNNASQDVAMIKSFINDLNNAGISDLHTSILLGSGAGTWQPDWKAYFTGLVAIPGLDKIDTHIYNLQPGINQLGEVAVSEQIADMAHNAGKGVTMSEFWFHKSSALVGLTENGDSLTDIRVRDMFGFWAPLDTQAFQMLSDLANYKHFDYVSSFGHYNWFTLIDYNSLQTVPVYPPANGAQNATVDDQITTILNQAAKQALAGSELSLTGKAYQSVISGQSK